MTLPGHDPRVGPLLQPRAGARRAGDRARRTSTRSASCCSRCSPAGDRGRATAPPRSRWPGSVRPVPMPSTYRSGHPAGPRGDLPQGDGDRSGRAVPLRERHGRRARRRAGRPGRWRPRRGAGRRGRPGGRRGRGPGEPADPVRRRRLRRAASAAPPPPPPPPVVVPPADEDAGGAGPVGLGRRPARASASSSRVGFLAFRLLTGGSTPPPRAGRRPELRRPDGRPGQAARRGQGPRPRDDRVRQGRPARGNDHRPGSARRRDGRQGLDGQPDGRDRPGARRRAGPPRPHPDRGGHRARPGRPDARRDHRGIRPGRPGRLGHRQLARRRHPGGRRGRRSTTSCRRAPSRRATPTPDARPDPDARARPRRPPRPRRRSSTSASTAA